MLSMLYLSKVVNEFKNSLIKPTHATSPLNKKSLIKQKKNRFDSTT